MVSTPRRFEQRAMLFFNPSTHVVQKVPGVVGCVFSELALMAGVVVDDPLAPERGGSVNVELNPGPTSARGEVRGWSWIEAEPAEAREKSFHPGMRVAGPNHVLASEVVEFTSAKSVHNAGWYAEGAQHHGHGTRKIFAVALLPFEQKICYWVGRRRSRQLESVAEVGAQILLDGESFIVVARWRELYRSC